MDHEDDDDLTPEEKYLKAAMEAGDYAEPEAVKKMVAQKEDEEDGEEADGAAAKTKKTAAKDDDEDPEIDLGEGVGKVKRSVLRDLQSKGADYSQKMEALAAQQKELTHLQELSAYLAENPKKYLKVMQLLEDNEEAQEEGTKKEKKAAVEDTKDAIEDILEQMDDTDPGAAVLKAIYKNLTAISKKISGFEEREQKLNQSQQQQQYQEQVNEGRNLLVKTIEDEDKLTGFETEEEKTMWRNMVLSDLRNNPKANYASKEDFVKGIKASCAKAAKSVKALSEQALKRYLEKKKPGSSTPPEDEAGKAAAKEKQKPKALNSQTLQDIIEAELAEEEANNAS